MGMLTEGDQQYGSTTEEDAGSPHRVAVHSQALHVIPFTNHDVELRPGGRTRHLCGSARPAENQRGRGHPGLARTLLEESSRMPAPGSVHRRFRRETEATWTSSPGWKRVRGNGTVAEGASGRSWTTAEDAGICTGWRFTSSPPRPSLSLTGDVELRPEAEYGCDRAWLDQVSTCTWPTRTRRPAARASPARLSTHGNRCVRSAGWPNGAETQPGGWN